jgi:Formyl transferase
MRILCCPNRDLASKLALNLLLPVGLTEQVGGVPAEESRQRRELRIAEQILPDLMLFPLVERAAPCEGGHRNLTFTEVQRLRGIPVDSLVDPNCASGLDLKADVIGIPPRGVLNLHSRILPAYRGVLATLRAMLKQETEVGCALHYIRDESIDTVEHVTDADAVDMRKFNSESDDTTCEDVHDDHHPEALQQDGLASKQIDAPQPVVCFSDGREPRRTLTAGLWGRVARKNPAHDVLVDFQAEGVLNLLGDAGTARARVEALNLEDCGHKWRCLNIAKLAIFWSSPMM